MLLGSSGQNIYPEEIEEKINSSPYVSESLAVSENGKIIALIVPDKDALQEGEAAGQDLNAVFQQVITEVNAQLPVYSKISSFRLQEEEFEKTPKRSIRRFKYQQ
jgi:long-chain acyl-CoA synthetase